MREVYERLHLSRLHASPWQDTRSAESRRNDEVDDLLHEWANEKKREAKILFTGCGGSGKATLLRHLRILYGVPYTGDERRQWKMTIIKNMLSDSDAVLQYMRDQRIEFENDSNKDYAQAITAWSCNDDSNVVSGHIFEALKYLRIDKGYQSALFQTRDSWTHYPHSTLNLHYFINNLERLSAPNDLPSDEDILRASKRLCGITEVICDIGERKCRLYELGGSRGERKKWIHLFDDCSAVFFLAALNEYDQQLSEDSSVNRLSEALTLFESVTRSVWFANSAIVLFFTKVDIFLEKVTSGEIPIGKYFPEYDMLPNDIAAAQEFFANKFKKVAQITRKEIQVHYINVLSAESVKEAMSILQI
ncbi:G-alpha-domain-containing protein [Viridothelium virens]|uniref:G-alpha-domain-containing protein n=1 Tax=Viridothelium virens TaxID=1048519 RepID=A0A6A6H382_VIRVR|nr:G-alpha-domain-containing protein [Viridothelium virens]